MQVGATTAGESSVAGATTGEATAADPTPTDPTPRPGLTRPDTSRPWRRAWQVGITTWVAAVITYVVVTALSWMIDDEAGPPMQRLVQAWDRWDTGHYIRIAQFGYTPDRPDTHAFFPLFPMLLRGLDTILPGPTLVASLVLSNVACIGALVVLHRFTAREFDPATADRALLFLMAWPAAFFLSAGYNGSLFLLLSVAALYCMRGGTWWAAGGLGALASATRLTGVLLVLAFVVEYARQHGWRLRAIRFDAAAVLLVPVGLAAFSAYCWVTLGDPLAFSHAQDEWGRRFAPPWVGLAEAIQAISVRPLLAQSTVHNLLDLVAVLATVGLLGLCVVGPWRLPRDQVFLLVYAAATLLVVLTGPVGGLFPMQGAPRYALELIPIFLLLARLGASRQFERLYLLPAVGLQVVLLLTFLNNVWVA